MSKDPEICCYWYADDREVGYMSPSDILSYSDYGEVAEIEHVAIVKTTFEARLPPADDADTDDDFGVIEDTREAAEAKIAAELARRQGVSAT